MDRAEDIMVMVSSVTSTICWEDEDQVEEIQGGAERRAVCGWLLPERGKSKALLPRLLRKNMKTPGRTLSSTMKWMEINGLTVDTYICSQNVLLF